MIIGGFLEMLSVSLIFPFMNAVMQPTQVMDNRYVQIVCKIFDLNSVKTFLIILAMFMALMYVIKNAFLLFEYNMQYRFINNNMLKLQDQLLQSYLVRPYEFFLHADSSVIIRIVYEDVVALFGLLSNLLSFYTEIIVSAFLIISTFITAPIITGSISSVLIILTLIITKVLKPKLRRLGFEARESKAGMYKWLMQTLQGIKEVKVMQKEEFFRNSFLVYGKRNITNSRKNKILSIVPRFMLEAVSMSSMFVIVAFMIYRGSELATLLPMLSAVAMAAVRLLPSVNRISASIGDIAYNEPTIDKVMENVLAIQGKENILSAELKQRKALPNDFKEKIELIDVVYHYPFSKKLVLNHADMKINKGESVGIIGASGAGKTTVVDLLLGLLSPQGGKVMVDNIDIDKYQGWLALIGYIPQTIYMVDGSIRDNVAFGISKEDIDDDMVWKALEDAALKDFIKEHPDGLDAKIGERGIRISGGQRQRIGIARALYKNPSVLFFDEATSALDNETEKDIMESIHALKGIKTIVIIAHRLSTIENCDKVFRVEGGKIIRDK